MQHGGATPRRNETPDTVEGSARALPTLAQIERQVIEARIEACSGNKSVAAKSLGISLKTLYNRLNEYKAEDARRA